MTGGSLVIGLGLLNREVLGPKEAFDTFNWTLKSLVALMLRRVVDSWSL